MQQASKEAVIAALEALPGLKNRISAVTVREGQAGFVLENPDHLPKNRLLQLQAQAEQAVLTVPGITHVLAVVTEDITGTAQSTTVQSPASQSPAVPRPPTPTPLPGIKHVVLVASGKGGVGKSTVAVNLAVSLAKHGYSTGLVDADIHGPSLARMLGLHGEPPVEDGKIVPQEKYGVKCLSMGTFLGEDVPVVWRGPMVTKALGRFLRGAQWGTLDWLVVDMPPGTGDIHISLAQNVSASGVVLVSTPQEVALLDVRKAISLYRKLGIPLLGLLENMAYLETPGGTLHPFGRGHVEALCAKERIAYLGALPIVAELSSGGDKGTPIAAGEIPNPASILFTELSARLAAAILHR